MAGRLQSERVADITPESPADFVGKRNYSDFDPSGWQMPVSVARKLQGLVAMLYPDLDIQVRPVAITLEQAIQYDLPSTPLKAEERRADKWKAAFGREQTEIDALMALHPGALARIAREAIRPFYDADLDVDVHEAQREWLQEARLTLQAHPDWETLRKEMEVVRRDAADAVQRLEAVQSRAEKVLANVVLPEMYVREAEVRDYAAGPALFHSTDDYITASKRLIAHKALSPIDAGDGE